MSTSESSGRDSDDAYYEDMDTFDPERPLEFELYEDLGNEATARQGAVKSYSVKQHGSAVYAEETSGYSISVQRLVWIDGYEKPPADGGDIHKQEMTLAVLKLVVSSRNPETKIQHMEATVQLRDTEDGGHDEPEIQAWAPFRTLQKWNSSAGQRDKAVGRNIGLTGGYSGAEISAKYSRESKISWEQTDFDTGQSSEKISKVTGRRNGVTWFVKQNRLQNQGATPELWVSLLFSRPSRKAYVVEFSINIRAGTWQAIQNKTKRFFGIGPGQSSAFTVTPSTTPVCNFEGKEILKCINSNSLGSLIGPDCSLTVSWGTQHQATTLPSDRADEPKTRPPSHLSLEGVDMNARPEDGRGRQSSAKDHSRKEDEDIQATKTAPWNTDGLAASPSPAVNSSSQPSNVHLSQSLAQSKIKTSLQSCNRSTEAGLPPLMGGWYTPNSGVDSVRLAALETRLAQVEARISAQDQIIFQLQANTAGPGKGAQRGVSGS